MCDGRLRDPSPIIIDHNIMSLPSLGLFRSFSDVAASAATPSAGAGEGSDCGDLLPQTSSIDDEFCLLHDVVHELMQRLDLLLEKLQVRATA